MDFQTFLNDEKSNCSYAWGGRNAYNLPLPDPVKYWRLCLKTDDQGAWGEIERAEWGEVDSTSAVQLAQLTPTSYSAFASTRDVGYIFGGKEHKDDGSNDNAKFYRSFHFVTKESKEHANPPCTTNSTLWGAKAVYVPDFGSSDGLIFILGGMRLRDEDGASYVDFEKLHFLDPATGSWHSQTTTSSGRGFP